MGVEDNQFQISNLNANTSFFDWYTKTNDEVIAKLNKLKLYELDVAGSLTNGISAEVGTSGGHTSGYLNLGVSDTIPHNLLIQGNVCTTGSFCYHHTATAATAGLTGYFVCVDSSGGITLSSASQSGITTSPLSSISSSPPKNEISGEWLKLLIRKNRFFHFGKNRTGLNRFFPVFSGFFRFFPVFCRFFRIKFVKIPERVGRHIGA